MKHKKTRKPNNAGYSLVEVLVTILIIGIISVPLVGTFVSSAKVNHRSRRVQNATDTAQNLAEAFGSYSIDDLIKQYKGLCEDGYTETTVTLTEEDAGVVTDSMTATKYAFEGITMEGAEGENFSVDVTMTPTAWYNVPRLHNFFGDAETVCVREVGRYDEYAISQLGGDRNRISKTVDIHLDTFSDGEYEYTISISYESSSGGDLTETMTIAKGNIEEDGLDAFPTLYILYAGFTNASPYCYDDIHLFYNNDNNATVKPVTVYFIPQNIEGAGGTINEFTNMYVYDHDGILYSADDANNKMFYYFYDPSVDKDALVTGDGVVISYDIDVAVYYESDKVAGVSSVREIEQ